MISLKLFEEFVRNGFVKKQSPDKERAESLVKDSDSKKEFFDKVFAKMSFEDISPNFIIESIYDILLELVRAKMLLNGFNSNNSHESEVAYMRNLGFSESEVVFMNELRYFRNGIKYYGKQFDKEYSMKVLNFMKRIYPRLKKVKCA